MQFQDIIYTKNKGVAKLVINRPERHNAFSAWSLQEMCTALRDAWADKRIGVVVLTGAGNKAFSAGGDQKSKEGDGYAKGEAQFGLLDGHMQCIHLVRAMPKPVIAMVNGFAVGGGHVLQAVCDLTIASETARFGQVGPRVGSFDAGFGTVYLARIVGEKKAREIWYLCRRYSAREALQMGLVNKVVPPEELEAEVDRWCREILEKSPTALAYLKASFNTDTDHLNGMFAMSMQAVDLYYQTAEAHEGVQAFMEKRPPDFSPFRR